MFRVLDDPPPRRALAPPLNPEQQELLGALSRVEEGRGPWLDQDGPLEAGDTPSWYEALFSPMAGCYDAAEKHLAAYALWQDYEQATADGATPVAGDDLLAALEKLHADNGHGWCRGCGVSPEQGGYTTKLPDCPTRRLAGLS
jgi:hypothetical protein